MTLTKQVTLDFSIPDVRKRRVRAGAEKRYNDCLDYLRAELASGKFERISADEISRVFRVTSSFMFMVTATGALTAKRIKGQGMHYRAEEKLATLTGKDLLNFRLAEFPNPPYEPEPVAPGQLADASPELKAEFAALIAPHEAAYQRRLAERSGKSCAPSESPSTPVFLVGRMAGNILSSNIDRSFDSPQEAYDFLVQTADKAIEKSVIVQVVQVYERQVIFKPSSL